MDYIINKIKELQSIKKINTKEFAKLINVTPQTLYDYFNGKTQISIKNLIKIAKAFNVPVSYFFDESDTVPPSVQNVSNNEQIEFLKTQIELLKQQLVDKQKIIELLEKKQ